VSLKKEIDINNTHYSPTYLISISYLVYFVITRESTVDPTPKVGEEEDVKNERQQILHEEEEGQSFILKTNNLTKV